MEIDLDEKSITENPWKEFEDHNNGDTRNLRFQLQILVCLLDGVLIYT